MSESLTFEITKVNYDAFKNAGQSSGVPFSELKISSLPLYGIVPKRMFTKERKVFSPGKTYLQRTNADTFEVRNSPNTTYTTTDYFIEFETTKKTNDHLSTLASRYVGSFKSKFDIITAPYIPGSPAEFLKLCGKSPLSKPMRILALLIPIITPVALAIIQSINGNMESGDMSGFYPYIIGAIIATFGLLLLPILLNALYQQKPYEKLSKGAKAKIKEQYKNYVYKKCTGSQRDVILETLEYLNRDSGEPIF